MLPSSAASPWRSRWLRHTLTVNTLDAQRQNHTSRRHELPTPGKRRPRGTRRSDQNKKHPSTNTRQPHPLEHVSQPGGKQRIIHDKNRRIRTLHTTPQQVLPRTNHLGRRSNHRTKQTTRRTPLHHLATTTQHSRKRIIIIGQLPLPVPCRRMGPARLYLGCRRASRAAPIRYHGSGGPDTWCPTDNGAPGRGVEPS